MKEILNKTAIVILSCQDYESLEISLANYLENTPKEVKIFLLQNCWGNYDKEKTWQAALRYKNLYPERLEVMGYTSGDPYFSIKTLLEDSIMQKYEYICKVDEDTFPVSKDWIEILATSYIKNKEKYGDKMAMTIPVVNNNCFGFLKTLEMMNLRDEYNKNIGRIHYGGSDRDRALDQEHWALKVYQQDEIMHSCCGSIWRYPYIARWIHAHTTLNTNKWIESLKDKGEEVFDNKIRYSINCMFCKKSYWLNLSQDNEYSDEEKIFLYNLQNDMKVVVCLSVPFVHLFYHTQRIENKDLIKPIREYYQKALNINYPIADTQEKDIDLENRLRYLENKIDSIQAAINNIRGGGGNTLIATICA